MTTEDLKRRIERLEETHETLETAVAQVNTTIALLNQTVEQMAKAEEKRQTFRDRGLLFVIGSFLSAVVAWVINGGLSQ